MKLVKHSVMSSTQSNMETIFPPLLLPNYPNLTALFFFFLFFCLQQHFAFFPNQSWVVSCSVLCLQTIGVFPPASCSEGKALTIECCSCLSRADTLPSGSLPKKLSGVQPVWNTFSSLTKMYILLTLAAGPAVPNVYQIARRVPGRICISAWRSEWLVLEVIHTVTAGHTAGSCRLLWKVKAANVYRLTREEVTF